MEIHELLKRKSFLGLPFTQDFDKEGSSRAREVRENSAT